MTLTSGNVDVLLSITASCAKVSKVRIVNLPGALSTALHVATSRPTQIVQHYYSSRWHSAWKQIEKCYTSLREACASWARTAHAQQATVSVRPPETSR